MGYKRVLPAPTSARMRPSGHLVNVNEFAHGPSLLLLGSEFGYARSAPFQGLRLANLHVVEDGVVGRDSPVSTDRCSTVGLDRRRSPNRSGYSAWRPAKSRRSSFRFTVDQNRLQEAELRDGHSLLRSSLTSADPAVLWTGYVQLTQIESAFRSLKSELGIRPIDHHLEHRWTPTS
jgi:hypothetical protein